MEIVKIQIFIAGYIGDNNFETIQSDIDDFMNKIIFCDNNISLMNEWSTEDNRNFWSNDLQKEYVQLMEQRDKLLKLFNDIRNVAETQ